MINPAIIRQYLARSDFLDLNKYKAFSASDVKKAYARLKDPVVFSRKPLHHQRICIYLGLKLRRLLLWLDMGTGKSYISMNLVNNWEKYTSGSVLITCLTRLNLREWLTVLKDDYVGSKKIYIAVKEDENEEPVFVRGNPVTFIKPSEVSKLLFSGRKDIILLVTFGGLFHPMTVFRTRRSKRAGAKKVDPRRVKKVVGGFQYLIVDEVTDMGSYDSSYFKMLSKLSEGMRYFLGLTGTPMRGTSLEPVWAQYYLADNGDTFGPNISFFRQAFYERREGGWSFTYNLRKDRKYILDARKYNRAIVYKASECIDLPRAKPIPIPLHMPADNRSHYNMIIKQLKGGSFSDLRQIESSYLKLRQLSSGYAILKSDVTQERVLLRMPQNPKLEVLVEKINNMPDDARMVVFCRYIATAQLIVSKGLWDADIPNICAHGKAPPQEIAKVKQFARGKGPRVLVATVHLLAKFINLQSASYMFFYEEIAETDLRMQADRRIRRLGQTRTCIYYEPYYLKSIDESIRKDRATNSGVFRDFVFNEKKARRMIDLLTEEID